MNFMARFSLFYIIYTIDNIEKQEISGKGHDPQPPNPPWDCTAEHD